MEASVIRAVVVSISDTRNDTNDISGDTLVRLLTESGAEMSEKLIVTDDFEEIRQTLHSISQTSVNLIVTTGGTGLAPRDNTPEATQAVVEKEIPGIGEAMRAGTLKFTKFAIISRGIAGIVNETLIINLPGSVKGVEQCFEIVEPILGHAVAQIGGNTSHD